MKHVYIILCIVLLVPFTVRAQDITPFKQSAYKNAEIGISVVDLSSTKKVVSFQTSPLVTPASTMKLVTTGAALELLGPDYTFKTTVSYQGVIENGLLIGDIRIVGSGDPSLGSRQLPVDADAFLKDWVNAIKRAGITSIRGNIVADPDVFDSEGVSPFWLWEDIGNYYATGIYGLNVYDNSFQLTLSSGAVGTKPVVVGIKPEIPGLTVENKLTTASNNLDSAYLYGAPFQGEMRLFGTMPAQREAFVIRGQIPDPPTLLAVQLQSALLKSGITVIGNAGSTRLLKASYLNRSEMLLHTTLSPPLKQLVRIIHEKSDNFYIEAVLRRLAAESGNRPASAVEGLRIVRSFWEKLGLDVSGLFQYDAAGLSPNNRISADFLVELLVRMQKQKTASVFEASLPIAGRQGTVSSFLQGTALEGLARLKSGSNQVVQSYAGYVRIRGKSYAVVMVVNHAQTSRLKIRKDMENFLLSL